MKLKLFLMTAATMALVSSCSSDDVIKDNAEANAITFSVTANNASRSADYWCNNEKPTYFEVSARYDNATYFDGDVFKDNSGIYKQNDGVYRYWPDLSVKAMSIWAYKVKEDNSATGTAFAEFALNEGAPTIAMKPKANAAEQRDLIYAYTSVTEKPALGKQVELNFRHALSQVVFYAKNENKKIDVKIKQIQIVNVAESGVFSLPKGNSYTNDNVDIHTNPTAAASSNGLGTWALNKADGAEDWTRATYTAVSNDQTSLTSTLKNLTDQTDQTHVNVGQALLLIPQTKYSEENNNSTTAWIPFTGSGDTKAYNLAKNEKKNSFILVYCKIQNISGASVVPADVYLVGDNTEEGWGKIAIPASFAWEQGKKYIYNINFTKTGHGGFDPETGKEVLVPIEFTVTVDDFASDETFNFNGDAAFN